MYFNLFMCFFSVMEPPSQSISHDCTCIVTINILKLTSADRNGWPAPLIVR